MNRRAYEFALRAATKVAFGTTFIGCGGTVTLQDLDEETEAEESTDAPEPRGTRPIEGLENAAHARPAEGRGAIACDGPAAAPEDWTVYDPQTFACCVDSLSELLPDDPTTQAFEPASIAVSGCCTQILSPNYQAIWANEPLPFPAPEGVVDACCNTAHGNVACTPWGPPVPPPMSAVALAAWMNDGALGAEIFA